MNSLNNSKSLPSSSSLSSKEDIISYTRLGGFNNLNNSGKNHVFSLKWAPNYPNLFASGDSSLNLRIFDISTKKQIISYKCSVNKNNNKTQNKKDFIIHGIDWNKKDYILLGVNINIFLFSFKIQNNNNEKYLLTLIHELKINSLVYNAIFSPDNNNIIVPCEDGIIYFYNIMKDNTDKITEINTLLYKEIRGHKKSVYQVIFNNSNTIMASSSDDMTIGIYDYESSQTTPRSKQTLTISKFLVGQENPIRQIIFLIDDTLISGSWNGIICIWNIHKLQLIYKIAENQSDIYGLSFSKEYPFLFAAAGRDATIRFWNLNYKINLKNLVEIDNSNIKDMECFIKKYFPEEDYDKFFKILNSTNKENELIENISKKEEKIKSEYSKYNLNNNDLGINNKIDFSLKQNDIDIIIEKLIKESAVIDVLRVFYELNILKNEDAICFSPKISIVYWQSLINNNERYINSDDYTNNKNYKESHN
jgi:WD40 repeat protein